MKRTSTGLSRVISTNLTSSSSLSPRITTQLIFTAWQQEANQANEEASVVTTKDFHLQSHCKRLVDRCKIVGSERNYHTETPLQRGKAARTVKHSVVALSAGDELELVGVCSTESRRISDWTNSQVLTHTHGVQRDVDNAQAGLDKA
jgi:hypothetical protein